MGEVLPRVLEVFGIPLRVLEAHALDADVAWAAEEMGRTQRGNNNGYCQDNEIGWVNWDLGPEDRELLEFTRQIVRIFQANPVLRRRSFFTGRPLAGERIKDIQWIRPDGEEMTDEDWADRSNHILGMIVPGQATDEVNERGRPIFGDTLLLLVNGYVGYFGVLLAVGAAAAVNLT